ncbi:CPBP family intramembrane metalloprotease, partial [Lactobacillus sp. XV13L]|nr:CPBP family intramembrane metalloprotease [Lactobacillus sp. XV13L]
MKNKLSTKQVLAFKILLVPIFVILEQLPATFLIAKNPNTLLILSISIVIIIIFSVVLQQVQAFATSKLNMKSLGIIAVASILLFALNKVMLPLFKATGNTNVSMQLLVLRKEPMLFFIYAMVIAPILEELLFRGYLLNALFHNHFKAGVIINSLIFGLLHVSDDPIYFMSKFLLGIVLNTVYLRTKNVKANIIVHLINNLTALLI